MALLMLLFLVCGLLLVLLGVQAILYKEELTRKAQIDPLEAGFERLLRGFILSSPFIFLAVLFVLFDLELLLLIPGVMRFLTRGSKLFFV
jgi:NADH:ubiquinone oxidoreductase subunit 3 (subunit A)